MSRLDVALLAASPLLAGLAIVGLVRRHRVRACVSFVAYLASVTIVSGLIAAFPSIFWNWEFYAVTDTLQAALRLGIAFEIAAKTFRPLPRGRIRMRVVLAIVTLATTLALLLYPRPLENAFHVTLLVDHASYGVAWLFTAFLLVVRYYRVPLDPLHRDVAAGVGALNLLLAYKEPLAILDPLLGTDFVVKTLYPMLLAAWNITAWRKEDFGELSPEAVRVLQPWRLP